MNVWQGGVRHESSLGGRLFLLSGAMALLIACLDLHGVRGKARDQYARRANPF